MLLLFFRIRPTKTPQIAKLIHPIEYSPKGTTLVKNVVKADGMVNKPVISPSFDKASYKAATAVAAIEVW